MHSQPTFTGIGDGNAVDWSLTSSRTVVADNTGVSDSEDELCSPQSPARFSRWYDMHNDQKDPGKSTVCYWSPDPAKLNSSFNRVARHSLPSAPASQSITQETLGKWERSAREKTGMCNQAAGQSRCLTKVQDAMVAQLKTLHSDKGKGNASGKLQHVEEFDYLVMFNRSITQAMARMMQDLSEGIFINMANLTMARRDSSVVFMF